jgi:methionyl-tRNA synthetase
MSAERILVAVAWPYANGPRHIGHVAGFGVPSDIFARYHRLRGDDVLMVSGTDEHGTPITVQAEREGITPEALVERNNEVIVEDLRRLRLSYDLFTRTTTANHIATTQDIFKKLHSNGYIISKSALGAFAAGTDRALPDRYIQGTCPNCGYGSARGDQCDNCGSQLDPTDLIEPRSTIDGLPPEFRESEHFFLDLPAFADRLGDWLRGKAHWRPNVRQYSLNFLAEAKPRAITRDIDWGVPIPLPGYGTDSAKRIYVWFDAVIGYLSASIEWAALSGDPDAWQRWWLDPEARHYYFMGKDNIVFHTIIWPSMLLGYGPYGKTGRCLELPHEVVSSEFLTMEGEKFSSSRGIVIYVRDVLDRYSSDSLRYYLAAAGPEAQDTNFTWSEFVRRNNDELVATWGNLVQRSVSLAHKHFGSVPVPAGLTDADRAVLDTSRDAFDAVGDAIAGSRFKLALNHGMGLAAQVNAYVSQQEPWKLATSDRERAGTVLNVALQAVADLTVLLSPFLPDSSAEARRLLGLSDDLVQFPEVRHVGAGGEVHRVLETAKPPAGQWQQRLIEPGTPLAAPTHLFRKLDTSLVEEELDRMRHGSAALTGEP